MTRLSVHTEWFNSGIADPLAAWLLPSALVFTGVLAAGLIGAFGTRSTLPGDAETSELPSIATIIGTAAPQSVRVAAAAPAAVTQPSYAFGFLEYDWDPHAPGGVPGFDSWRKHDLSVAETSPRN